MADSSDFITEIKRLASEPGYRVVDNSPGPEEVILILIDDKNKRGDKLPCVAISATGMALLEIRDIKSVAAARFDASHRSLRRLVEGVA